MVWALGLVARGKGVRGASAEDAAWCQWFFERADDYDSGWGEGEGWGVGHGWTLKGDGRLRYSAVRCGVVRRGGREDQRSGGKKRRRWALYDARGTG